jgi:CheY-like chemotaxis protein
MTQRLLLVDDEVFNHEFIKMVLQPLAYQVDTVSSAPQALEYLYQQLPDLLIVDMVMPGLSGLDLVRLLRHNPQTSSLLILMLSGMDSQADQQAAHDAGVDAFLPKPITAEQLRWQIAQLLATKRSV